MTTKNEWFKSSHSNASMSCVEVKFDNDAILVRDSKDKRTGQPILSVAAPQWRAFLSAFAPREDE